MNLVFTSMRASANKKFWKHGLLLLLLLLAVVIYVQWNMFITQIIEWHKLFHALLAKHMTAVSQNAFTHGCALIALSFAYGVFHAIGPGHGKAVIVTYLGTHKESIARGIAISLIAALLQSIIAIALVIILAKILSLQFAEINNYGNDITLVSYVMVMLLGVFLLCTALYRLFSIRVSTRSVHYNEVQHHHSYDNHGCCGSHHAHRPADNETWLQAIAVVLSIGLRPCAGAIIVLIYAHLVDFFSMVSSPPL
jgi:ABC-type nickel/cobalt efflux system permease component RcnA